MYGSAPPAGNACTTFILFFHILELYKYLYAIFSIYHASRRIATYPDIFHFELLFSLKTVKELGKRV